MKNIDLFETYTAAIFARLYEAFPLPCALDAQQISDCPGIDEFGAMQKPAEICRATMGWLADSGYIRAAGATQYAMTGAVLTAKGLEALKATPEALSGKTPVGERIAQLVATGSMDLAREAARVAISSAVKLFLQGG